MGLLLAPSEPGDVVEAALEISALGEGLALVSKDRPDLFLVVERHDEARAYRLEHWIRALVLEERDSVGFPGATDIASLSCSPVERGDERLDLCFHLGIARGFVVVAFHRDRVIAVGDLVMRVDVARNEDQGLHRFGLEALDVEGPRFGNVQQGAGRCDRNRGCETGCGSLQESASGEALCEGGFGCRHGCFLLFLRKICWPRAATGSGRASAAPRSCSRPD